MSNEAIRAVTRAELFNIVRFRYDELTEIFGARVTCSVPLIGEPRLFVLLAPDQSDISLPANITFPLGSELVLIQLDVQKNVLPPVP